MCEVFATSTDVYEVSFTESEALSLAWFSTTCKCTVEESLIELLVKAVDTINDEIQHKDTKELFADVPDSPIYDVKFVLPEYLGDLHLVADDIAFITATLQMSLCEAVTIVTYKRSIKENPNVMERSHEEDGPGESVVPID